MSDGACIAVVARWSDDEGWGVAEAEQLPGGCWAHFSVIDADGWRALTPGSRVAVWWSLSRQDGYPFRADRVLPLTGPDHAEPFSDSEMLASLRSVSTGDVEVVSVEQVAAGVALLRFRAVRGGEVWAVEVPLPSSRLIKPWLYCTPDDASDAARMLGYFLDEEVVTRAVRSARRDAQGRLVLATYGFEQADPVEHERLQQAAGDDGWYGRQTEAGSLDFTQAADG